MATKKVVIAVLVVLAILLLVAGGVVLMFNQPGPSLDEVKDRKNPKIVNLPATKVISISVSGDPNKVLGGIFGALSQAYYKIPGVNKSQQNAPRARWKLPEGKSISDLTSLEGEAAYAVPDSVTSLPGGVDSRIQFKTWEYGDVAEILHVGSYSTEPATVDTLKQFIADSGYKVVGDHEEEYLKGPGLFFPVDPKSYLTIIRYRVEKSIKQ